MAGRARPVSVDVCKYEILDKGGGGKRHAVYVCRVHVTQGRAPWYILRRYKQWEELLDALEDVPGRGSLPPLPGKKVFGNMEPKFLEGRRRELQTWVTQIIRFNRLCESDAMWDWLQPQPVDTEYGRGSSPAELMLESGPPAMQGFLELVDSTNGCVRHWFELRGRILAWFTSRDGDRLDVVDMGDAIVTTSRALQNDPTRTGVDVGVVSPTPGASPSFFSIKSRGAEYVVGAPSEDQMRAWVSAILNLQGDRQGAAALAMGRTTITSHSMQPTSPPLHGPLGPLGGNDPLGHDDQDGADDPLGALQEDMPDVAGLPGSGLATTDAQPGSELEAAFRKQGGIVARVQVKFVANVFPMCSEGEPEPEPESTQDSIVPAEGAHILCICQLNSEFGVAHIHCGEDGHELCALATIPIVAGLKCAQADGLRLGLSIVDTTNISNPQPTADASFSFAFTNLESLDNFATTLEELRRVAEGMGQLHVNERTHQWLRNIDEMGSPRPSTAPAKSESATSLFNGSSEFWASTNESKLLDPERRRGLKCSVDADSSGAQRVKLLPHTSFGQGMFGQASLQTRLDLRDGKEITVYELALDRDGFQWTVSRRHSDFVALQDALKASWPDVVKRMSANFPSKKLLASSTDPAAVFQRSIQLFEWLNALMHDPQTTRAKELISFLGMKMTADNQTAAGGNTSWHRGQPGVATGSPTAAFASVDRLGRSITQLINEQSALVQPDEVVQQLLECRAFRDALLTPIFDAKRLNGGGGKRVRLKLLGDSLCIAAANSPDTEVEVEPYAQMELQFDSPRLHLLSTETEASKCFEVSPVDGPRLVAELEDRIELACHIVHKEEQLKLSQTDPGELTSSSSRGNFDAAEYRRKLDELSGKTESERIAAAVDKTLNGSSAEDQREITRPLLHFLTVTFRTLLDAPDTVAVHVREVMTDLQETIMDPDGDRYGRLVSQLAEPTSEAVENLSRIVNERLELVVVAPVVEEIEECLRRSFGPGHLQRIDAKREALRANPQEYFGIVADSRSPSGWRAAVDEVDSISQHRMPSGKLHALLRSTTKIYDLFTAERAALAAKDGGDNKPPADQFLAADEFLSVFIFVLVQSTLEELPVTCKFMSTLCDPELLSGQHGYYLTVFESAIQCIADADAGRDMISAVARTSSTISRSSVVSPILSPRLNTSANVVEGLSQLDLERASSDGDESDGREVDSPLSTGRSSDEDIPLFAGPKPKFTVVMEQDDFEDSPLFHTAPKKVPSRNHPGRAAICARDSVLPASSDDEGGDDFDAMSKSTAGQWMQAAEVAWSQSQLGSGTDSNVDSTELSPNAGNGLFSPPPIGQ